MDLFDALRCRDQAHHDDLGDLRGPELVVAGDDRGDGRARGQHRIGDHQDGTGLDRFVGLGEVGLDALDVTSFVGLAGSDDVVLVDQILVDDPRLQEQFVEDQGGADAGTDEVNDGHRDLGVDHVRGQARTHARGDPMTLLRELITDHLGEEMAEDEGEQVDGLLASRLLVAEFGKPSQHQGVGAGVEVAVEAKHGVPRDVARASDGVG